MADIKKYISDYSGQINLSLMSPERRARLEQLRVLGVGLKEQIGALDPTTGLYKGGWNPDAALPDGTHVDHDMDDAAWEKLYMQVQKTLLALKNDPKLLAENSDAKKLVDDFYGAAKIIKDYTPSTIAVNRLMVGGAPSPDAITWAAYLDDPNIKVFLEDSIDTDEQDKVISALRTGSFTSDLAVCKKIRHVSAIIYNAIISTPRTLPTTPPAPAFITARPYSFLMDIYNNITQQEKPVDADRDAFRNAVQTNDQTNNIFLRLVQKAKALEAFDAKDESGVANAIAVGLKEKNYKEGKYELTPMDEHSYNVFQKAGNKINHIKNDMLGKLTMRHKRHPYYMDETAKPIMESLLVKRKFDITKGLDEFLKQTDAISGDLKGGDAPAPKAVPHFEWFTKTLKEISKVLPKEFAGALKDTNNLNAVVQAIIERGVDDGKIEEAQTALECLSQMRYGYTTSGTKNKLKAVPVNILGDKGLSFNSNQAIHMITKSLDKTMHAGIMLGANLVAVGRAIYQKKNLKFKSGTESVKRMIQADEAVRGYTGTPAEEAVLVADVQAKKTAYETLARVTPPASKKDIKQAEDSLQLAETTLSAFRQTDYTIPYTPGVDRRRSDSNLTKKQNLMAFWNYVNDPSSQGLKRDMNIFNDDRRAQAMQNKSDGVNTQKNINLEAWKNRLYNNIAA